MKMALELPKSFQIETRRLLWLVGLVFATILLFQFVELPKGSVPWSWAKLSEERIINSFLSGNASSEEGRNGHFTLGHDDLTIPPQSDSSIIGNNTSSEPYQGQNGHFTLDHDNVTIPPESNSSTIGNNTSSELSEGQNGHFPLDHDEPSVPSKSDVSESNTSTIRNNTSSELSQGQSGLFTLDHNEPSVPPESDFLHSNTSVIVNNSSSEPSQDQNGHFTLDHNNLTIPPKSDAGDASPDHDARASIVTPKQPTMSPSVHRHPSKPESGGVPPPKENLTWPEMNDLLIQSHLSPHSPVPRWSTRTDEDLALARSEIAKASSSDTGGLHAPLYRNASEFYRSYELMEKTLKVYIYKEGDRPVFHTPALQGIYASEGWFMKLLKESKHFVTKMPSDAHLFYLPFSSYMLEQALYVPNSHRRQNLVQCLGRYVDLISSKYPFWNRTLGADHFLVACHDWAPSETRRVMRNCIRALCNADVNEGFEFGKDVSLPETNVRNVRNPTRDRVKGNPPSKRKTLAFYAGGMHGYLRPILLRHWGPNATTASPDIKIFSRLPHTKGDRNYIDCMKKSRYCICPRGYEVNSPRVVESILYECVPVIISDNFVPPLFETLNWRMFSVFVKEKDVPRLGDILAQIPEKEYIRMYVMVKKVQRHFIWHSKPIKYDLFHMILHSIWYNRVFQYRLR